VHVINLKMEKDNLRWLFARKEGEAMRRTVLAIALAFALIFGYAVARSMADEMTQKSVGTSDINNLLGASVKNSQGELLGIITDFVKEPDGRGSFAILNFGKYEDYGEGGRMVAVPFGTLSCAGHDCALNSSYENLASSPVFLSKDELTERKLAEDIYRYFGVQPYWTEEESSKHEAAPEYY
jgi:hypothetical protein